MKQPVGSMDRRQSSLRSGPATPVVQTPDDDKQKRDVGRNVEFVNAITHSRSN